MPAASRAAVCSVDKTDAISSVCAWFGLWCAAPSPATVERPRDGGVLAVQFVAAQAHQLDPGACADVLMVSAADSMTGS